MIWNGEGIIEMEEGEPGLRSCPKCNSAHKHLLNVNWLHSCLWCDSWWVLGRYLEDFTTDEEFDTFFQSLGMKLGDSTTTINIKE